MEDGVTAQGGIMPGASSSAPPAKSTSSSPSASFAQVRPPAAAVGKGAPRAPPPKEAPPTTTNVPTRVDSASVPASWASWTPDQTATPRPKAPLEEGQPDTFLRTQPAQARAPLPQPPSGHVGGQTATGGALPGARSDQASGSAAEGDQRGERCPELVLLLRKPRGPQLMTTQWTSACRRRANL